MEKEAVREQLSRILSSALFRHSKRFPAFLRHTVEHGLSSTDSLKERTIGHEVFGRDPAYDTSQDPIVRMAAAEVRKRLAQYYQSPEHAAEIVIAYQPGSYVPEFYRPPTLAGIDAAPMPVESDPERRQLRLGWGAAWVMATVAAAVLIALAVGRSRDVVSPNALQRFWSPILSSSSPVLLCIGDPSSAPLQTESNSDPAVSNPSEITIDEFLRSNSVRYTDSVTLALLTGELRSRSRPFRIRRTAATELQDLRDGPVILIGGFNNPWTLRLSEGLRFTLARDEKGTYIRDRDQPDRRPWQVGHRSTRLKDLTETYGLITRVQDPATGHSVVSVSGLVLGTRAAGECLIDVECLSAAEQMGRGGFEHGNVQIVVATTVVGDNSGAPRVVAVYGW
jgi:hypothetical protein